MLVIHSNNTLNCVNMDLFYYTNLVKKPTRKVPWTNVSMGPAEASVPAELVVAPVMAPGLKKTNYKNIYTMYVNFFLKYVFLLHLIRKVRRFADGIKCFKFKINKHHHYLISNL